MIVSLWAVCLFLAGDTGEEGFVSLFDGKTLDGWNVVHPVGPGYVPKEGVLICPADGGGNCFTNDEYANFVFRFDFKLSPGGNNGVGIRAPLEGDAAYVAMEVQVLDDPAIQYLALRPAQYCGSVYDVFAAKKGSLKPTGEWNAMEIACDESKVKVTLNGNVITDGDIATVTDEATLKKHPGLKRTSGHIGFLGHGTLVEFKNIRVKKLP
ncbi:DUF1080 domain-containing protein [bacterium]|nr:DUF1080 domain-containing protein [bacterium]